MKRCRSGSADIRSVARSSLGARGASGLLGPQGSEPGGSGLAQGMSCTGFRHGPRRWNNEWWGASKGLALRSASLPGTVPRNRRELMAPPVGKRRSPHHRFPKLAYDSSVVKERRDDSVRHGILVPPS